MKLYFYLEDAENFHRTISDDCYYMIYGAIISKLPPTEEHYCSQKYQCIAEADIDFRFDEKPIKDKILKKLEQEESEIRAQFQKDIDSIMDKKQQLLSIEHHV